MSFEGHLRPPRELSGNGPATGNAASDRLVWLDAARGIGIILVVYAHGARALPDVLPHTEEFRQADALIYAFHMPLFFFLAGLVSRGSLNRSRARYLSGKLVTVVYPYFLWSIIYWGLELAFRDRVNSQLDPASILWILWRPIEHLWFLYVLFVCQVLATAAWPRVVVLVLASAWIFVGSLPAITVPMLWVQLPWFTAGLLLAPIALRPDVGRGLQAGFALAVAGSCAMVFATPSALVPLARAEDFLVAGIGIGLTVALATALQANRLITYLGRASLSIYLLHTIFSAGVREFLEIVYPVSGIIMLVVTVAAGMIAPLAVDEMARRIGATPYLGLGKMASASPEDQRDESNRTA